MALLKAKPVFDVQIVDVEHMDLVPEQEIDIDSNHKHGQTDRNPACKVLIFWSKHKISVQY